MRQNIYLWYLFKYYTKIRVKSVIYVKRWKMVFSWSHCTTAGGFAFNGGFIFGPEEFFENF